MPAKNALAYLVRVWLEPGESGGVWRASVTDLTTRQVHYFTDYAAFLDFIHLNMIEALGWVRSSEGSS